MKDSIDDKILKTLRRTLEDLKQKREYYALRLEDLDREMDDLIITIENLEPNKAA